MTLHLFDVLAGMTLGLLLGWFAGRLTRGMRSRDLMEAQERHRLETRRQFEELATARARAEAKLEAVEDQLLQERTRHSEQIKLLRSENERALAELKDAFQGLSADALRKTHPEFLRLAKETLGRFQEAAKGDLAARQQAISTLVKPLEDHLKTYQERLAQSETAHAQGLGELKHQLQSLTLHSQTLSQETSQLRRVLSSNQARGRWGEETLRRVVEAAGLNAHCDFVEQVQEGDRKPDLIVRLPGNRLILVDAKVPDLDFLRDLESTEGPKRSEALAKHAQRLKATIKALADRDYPGQFPNALDHVVLFLPAESLFSAALEGDHELILWAASRRIMLATPTSLIALLRSVSVTWQQHAQSENARAIAQAAKELYRRVSRFTEHLDRLRSGLERANAAFNDAVGSYERSVRPSGERIVKLANAADPRLKELTPSAIPLRTPSQP